MAGTEEPSLAVWRTGDPLEALAAARARGALLFLPTESSYGIGVDPRNREAVERVYVCKGRDGGKALPVVLADVSQVAELGIEPETPAVAAALDRAAGCWPGPLTVLLPLPAALDLPAAAGIGHIAVRIPDHAGLRGILAAIGPLTATSANASGEAPVIDPAELSRWIADSEGCRDAVLIDGGILAGGPPSTLVVFEADGSPRVLRPGRLSAAQLASCMRRS